MAGSKSRWEAPNQWDEWSRWLAAGLHALYGHRPPLCGGAQVTISLALRHPKCGPIGLPLLAVLYVGKKTMATIPKVRSWPRFATKLELAARLVEWIVPILKEAGKTVWIVVDGGYTKRPSLKRVLRLSNVTIVGRLRKAAALRDLPPRLKKGQRRGRGRPRIYGKNRLSLPRRPRGRCPAAHRPSRANRRKALRQQILEDKLSTITRTWSLPEKNIDLVQSLMALAT